MINQSDPSVKILQGPPSQNFLIFICLKQWEINQLLFVPGSIIKIWPAGRRCCRVGETFVFLRLMMIPAADSRTRALNANKAIVIHLKQRLAVIQLRHHQHYSINRQTIALISAPAPGDRRAAVRSDVHGGVVGGS